MIIIDILLWLLAAVGALTLGLIAYELKTEIKEREKRGAEYKAREELRLKQGDTGAFLLIIVVLISGGAIIAVATVAAHILLGVIALIV